MKASTGTRQSLEPCIKRTGDVWDGVFDFCDSTVELEEELYCDLLEDELVLDIFLANFWV